MSWNNQRHTESKSTKKETVSTTEPRERATLWVSLCQLMTFCAFSQLSWAIGRQQLEKCLKQMINKEGTYHKISARVPTIALLGFRRLRVILLDFQGSRCHHLLFIPKNLLEIWRVTMERRYKMDETKKSHACSLNCWMSFIQNESNSSTPKSDPFNLTAVRNRRAA